MPTITLTLLQALERAVSAYNAGSLVEAEQICQQLVSAKHDFFDAHHLLAIVQSKLGRRNDALASFDRALLVQPNNAQALNNRGITLKELKRFDEALASYDSALTVRPDFAEALFNRGNTLHELKRLDEALVSYDRSLKIQPGYADALGNRGNTLKELKRLEEALASYERALAAKIDDGQAFSGAAECAIRLCDWDRRTRFAAELNANISNKKLIISPFVLLSYSSDLALQLQCARYYIEDTVPSLPRPLWTGETWRHDKLQVAYLAADFHQHATAHLMAELFERHDRSRFEIIGVSFGVDDHSEMRKRLIAAFDQFHDVRRKSNEEVAQLLHDLQADIAIDLKGYTQDSRPGILAYRPAPIQVNYLGYPGTMGTEFIDYIIADKVVVPFEHQRFYTEKIVHLPDCYQVNDNKRKITERVPMRQEVGLPEQGFVFCCFSNNWKITPQIFDVWMRLLHHVEGSVLWLYRDNENAEQNLRKEALARGINSSRLIFAGRLPPDEHLARYRLADLFLDTLPYNAHTTASDALWVGLPVLTCKGEAFAGLVASSLLNAVGLPELATTNLDEYEAQALELARDAALLADMKAKLARNRNTCPLFNTVRFTRHIEAAYTTMWKIWQRGETPKSFSVEPI
jgi:predicted O-linked N-acetylglucosamine transferase (SPINDLY family)